MLYNNRAALRLGHADNYHTRTNIRYHLTRDVVERISTSKLEGSLIVAKHMSGFGNENIYVTYQTTCRTLTNHARRLNFRLNISIT